MSAANVRLPSSLYPGGFGGTLDSAHCFVERDPIHSQFIAITFRYINATVVFLSACNLSESRFLPVVLVRRARIHNISTQNLKKNYNIPKTLNLTLNF